MDKLNYTVNKKKITQKFVSLFTKIVSCAGITKIKPLTFTETWGRNEEEHDRGEYIELKHIYIC